MAQYIQNLSETTPGWLPLSGVKLKKLILNMVWEISSSTFYGMLVMKPTAVKVAGKNAMVTIEIVFIASLSTLVALLISVMTLLSL